jgi:hypothetical protein
MPARSGEEAGERLVQVAQDLLEAMARHLAQEGELGLQRRKLVDLVDGGDAVLAAVIGGQVADRCPQCFPLSQSPVPHEPHGARRLAEQRPLCWCRFQAIAKCFEHHHDMGL